MKLLKVLGSELKIRLSPSFIQNAACPAYLKFRYVDKVNEKYVRVEAERGKAVHGAIAELLEFCRTQSCEVSDLEPQTLAEAVQRNISPRILGETGLVLEWVKLWQTRFEMPANIHGIEEKISIDDEYDECAWEDASYRGIIDLTEVRGSHCIVWDWKSQPHIVSQSEIDLPLGNDMAEQMTHYCWMLWKLYPHLRTWTVRVWYLRYGFYMETSRTVDDLIAFENALMIKEKKISEIENWDPQPGRHCQYCDYIQLCPIAQDLSPGNSEVITQEQAVLAAQRATVYEALTKQLKAKLKIYVNHNDDVRIGDNWTYGYKHKESVEWDPKAAEETLRGHNRELSEVANVNVKKMKKALKKFEHEEPMLAAELVDLCKTKHKTEFKGFQQGEEDADQPGEEG
jgi:hypothetical protein